MQLNEMDVDTLEIFSLCLVTAYPVAEYFKSPEVFAESKVEVPENESSCFSVFS